jgi:hypothetical protein
MVRNQAGGVLLFMLVDRVLASIVDALLLLYDTSNPIKVPNGKPLGENMSLIGNHW